MALTPCFGQDAFTHLTANIVTTPAPGTSETWPVFSTGLPWVQIVTGQQMLVTVASMGETNPEIIAIVGIVDTTHFTVLRGQENTTPKTHSVNDILGNNITAGLMNMLIAAALGTSGIAYGPVTVTSNYTVSATGTWVRADATTSNTILGLVVTTAATTAGFAFTLTKIDASTNPVTFSPFSGLINGQSRFTLTSQWDSVDIICDGQNWGLH